MTLVSRRYRRSPSPRSRRTSAHHSSRSSGDSGSLNSSSGSNVRGENESVSGNTTGSISSGRPIGPNSSYTIGNGSPQYRWRLNSQSRSLKLTVPNPTPCDSSQALVRRTPSATESIPLRSNPLSLAELTYGASPVNACFHVDVSSDGSIPS